MPDTTPLTPAANSSSHATDTPSQHPMLGDAPARGAAKPRRSMARVLEPRVLFDAAAAATAADVADQTAGQAAADTGSADVADHTVDPALFAAPAVDGRREAYVIDKGVQGYQSLLNQVPQGAEIFLIDSSSSGLSQLNTLLASTNQQFDAIHIISHGTDGAVQLGGDILSSENVSNYQTALQELGTHLTANGDLMIYGCDVAETEKGQHFLQVLSDYTGADVAASTDDTGGPGGNTILEAHAGSIESDPWAAPNLLNDPLTLYSLSGGVETGGTGEQLGRSIDASGDWVVAGANGSIQVWKVAGTTHTETIIARPGTASTDFGASVSIDVASNGSTGTIVVADRNAGSAGYLYVYRLSNGVWSLTASLDVNAVATGTRIGQTWNANYQSSQWLAVSGTHIAVGLPTEGGGTGRIIWYEDNSSGAFTAFTSGVVDEVDTGGTSEESFGASLDIAGGVLVVGAPSADVNGSRSTSGFASWSSSITQITGNNHGAVFVYNWSTGGGPSYANIMLQGNGDQDGGGAVDSDGGAAPAANARFGAAVAIEYYAVPHTDGTAPSASEYKYTIVGGAPGEAADAGEIYVYQSNDNNMTASTNSTTGLNPYRVLNIYGLAGTWNTAGDAIRKGTEVSISQGTVLIASTASDQITDNAVYVLRSIANNWYGNGGTTNAPGAGFESLIFKSNMAPMTGAAIDNRYGTGATLVGGSQLVIGAPLNDMAGTNNGTVVFYFVRLPYAVSDTFNLSEDDGTVTIDVKNATTTGSSYANDGGDDVYGSLTDAQVVVTGSQAVDKGALVWGADSNTFTYNPNAQFEYLGAGQTETVYLSYVLTGPDGFVSQANVTLNINGRNDAPSVGGQLDNITVPRSNAGVTSFSSTIPITAFQDVDQNAVLTYTIMSTALVPGGGGVGAPASLAGITASGSYNVATQANSGQININTSALTVAQVGTGIAYDVVVRATDDQGATVTQTIRVYIAPDNAAPTSTTVPAQSATEDVIFSLNLRDPNNNNDASDAYFKDNDITTSTGYDHYTTPTPDAVDAGTTYTERLTFTIQSQGGPGADWLTVSPDGVLSGSPTNDNVGVTTVTVRATDMFGKFTEQTFTVTVGNTNDAPVQGYDIERQTAVRGSAYSFNIITGAGGISSVTHDAPYTGASAANPFYFYDWDNYTGTYNGETGASNQRSPSASNTITYTAFNPIDGDLFGTTGTGAGNNASGNDLSWLSFNGTTFTGTPPNTIPLGTVLIVGLRATDNNGAVTETTFELGVYPTDQVGGTNALPTPDNGQMLGYDVAINSGSVATGAGLHGSAGRWAVVGMPGDNSGAGRIYIYENTNYNVANSAPAWTQVATFVGAANSALGTSVDISADGKRIVAGAPLENNGAGAVYYYVNSAADGAAGAWAANATAKGTALAADSNAGDHFGQAVAINQDGSRVLVGAPLDDEAATNAGAAYVFNFGTAATVAADKLMPTADSTESRAGDMFGFSVAFDRNILVVGAPRDDVKGMGATAADSFKIDAGSAYVYKADATTTFVKLMKPVAEVRNTDYFGYSVDADYFAYNGSNLGSLVVAVGVPGHDIWATDAVGVSTIKYLNAGAVYVYRSDSITGAINTSNPTPIGAVNPSRVVAYDPRMDGQFGIAVAIDANEFTGTDNANDPLHMAVGGNPASGGTVYALRYKSTVTVNYGWVGQRHVVTDGDPGLAGSQPVTKLGNAVDIGGLTLIGGAPETTRTGGTNYFDTGTTQYNAGTWFGWGLSTAVSPIELSGTVPKTVAVDDLWVAGGSVGGVMAAGKSSVFGLSSLSMLDDEEWKRLLTPVSDWAPAPIVASIPVLLPAAAERYSYSDELLFDALSRQVAVNDAFAESGSAVEEAKSPEQKPVKEKHTGAPDKNGSVQDKPSRNAEPDSKGQQKGEPSKEGEVRAESKTDAASLGAQLQRTAATHNRNAVGLLDSLKSLVG